MPTITVEPEIYQQLEAVAQEKQADAEQLAQEALKQYIWEQNNRKISEESAHYKVQHPRIKEQYLGQFIAMHLGQIVDHDANFESLKKRIRERFGNVAVMITKVEEEPYKVISRRGVRYQ